MMLVPFSQFAHLRVVMGPGQKILIWVGSIFYGSGQPFMVVA